MKFINKIEFSSQIWGCPDGANMLALADRVGAGGPLVYVARDDVRMMAMRDALALLLLQAEVLMFPAWDCLPFDRLSPQGSLVGQRIETLARLRGLIPTPDNDPDDTKNKDTARPPAVLLTTVNAFIQRVPPQTSFADQALTSSAGAVPRPAGLASFLGNLH